MNAKVAQVGGDHYQSSEQHWDIIEEFDIAYLEATASKYVVRYDKKGKPREDLEKAKSYLQRALVEQRGARRLIPGDRLHAFNESNQLNAQQRRLLIMIHVWGTSGDLQLAINMIDIMLMDITVDNLR